MWLSIFRFQHVFGSCYWFFSLRKIEDFNNQQIHWTKFDNAMKRSLSFLYRNGFMCKPCSIRSWKCRWVLLIKLIKQASAYEAYDRTRTRTPMHTSKILGRCKKKAHLVWLKKLQGVRKIARLKQQRFLSLTLHKTHRSYEKIMCICYFIGSVVKIVLYLHFLYTKDGRLQQIKKKHEWWNNLFSDVFTYCLNLKNFASLFFLIQDNFMF